MPQDGTKHFPNSDCWNLGLFTSENYHLSHQAPHSEKKQHIIDLVQVQASSCPVHGQITPCSPGFSVCVSLLHPSQQLSLQGLSQAKFYPAFRLWAKHSITNYTTIAEMGGMQIGAPRDSLGSPGHLRNQVKKYRWRKLVSSLIFLKHWATAVLTRCIAPSDSSIHIWK